MKAEGMPCRKIMHYKIYSCSRNILLTYGSFSRQKCILKIAAVAVGWLYFKNWVSIR
jgi:hypothetical protein